MNLGRILSFKLEKFPEINSPYLKSETISKISIQNLKKVLEPKLFIYNLFIESYYFR